MSKSHGNNPNGLTLENEIRGIQKLLEYVSVDINTGLVVWRKLIPHSSKNIGDSAGTLLKSGYTQITFDKKRYRRHRIVFYVAKGYLPKIVDHIDGVDAGDMIDNLQEVNASENQQKRKHMKNNTSGYRGVSFIKSRNKYMAQIKIDGKSKNLGYFDCAKLAALRYNEYAKEYFGSFAVLNQIYEI